MTGVRIRPGAGSSGSLVGVIVYEQTTYSRPTTDILQLCRCFGIGVGQRDDIADILVRAFGIVILLDGFHMPGKSPLPERDEIVQRFAAFTVFRCEHIDHLLCNRSGTHYPLYVMECITPDMVLPMTFLWTNRGCC